MCSSTIYDFFLSSVSSSFSSSPPLQLLKLSIWYNVPGIVIEFSYPSTPTYYRLQLVHLLHLLALFTSSFLSPLYLLYIFIVLEDSNYFQISEFHSFLVAMSSTTLSSSTLPLLCLFMCCSSMSPNDILIFFILDCYYVLIWHGLHLILHSFF